MPNRIQLRRFRRGEKRLLNAKLHARKLPVWIAHRYRLIGLVYAGLSILAAARQLACAKETAYRWIKEFNRLGFHCFDRASHPEGRPSQLSQQDLRLLHHIAQKRPTDVGLPFTNWSIAKLREYLVKKRGFPKVSPEWLRRLLRRAKISWQRTKTWKQSHDPEFKAKKSTFWPCMPNVRRVGLWSATINWVPWNCGPSQAGVGRGISIRNGIAPPTRGSAAWSNSMVSTMSMRTASWDGSANAKRPETLWRVSRGCDNATRGNSAFMWYSTISRRISAQPMNSFLDITWKRSTHPRMRRG